MAISEQSRTFFENTTGEYTTTLKDASGTVIPTANIDSLTLTLKNKATGQIINSREAQSVLNTNNVTVHATSGLLTWDIQAADTVLVKGSRVNPDRQEHIALFHLVFNTTEATKRTVTLIVKKDP